MVSFNKIWFLINLEISFGEFLKLLKCFVCEMVLIYCVCNLFDLFCDFFRLLFYGVYNFVLVVDFIFDVWFFVYFLMYDLVVLLFDLLWI